MDGSEIVSVTARQVFSGRGHPAVEATVVTKNGGSGTAQCTAGLSIGTHEIAFIYDGGSAWRGMGVTRAVDSIVHKIAPAIIGMDAAKQFEVDNQILNLDGPDAKLRLGGNAVAAVSSAVLRAGANSLGIPLYRHIGGGRAMTLPCASIGLFGGGIRYSKGERSGSKPTYSLVAHGFSSFSEASYALYEVSADWSQELISRWGLRPQDSLPGFTGGGMFTVPPGLVESDWVLWDMATEKICKKGHEGRIGLQGDLAADCYYNRETGVYHGLFDTRERTREELIETIIGISGTHPFVIIEDPVEENDFDGHAILTRETGIQVVGDDLFATNAERVKQGAAMGACNAVLLKVGQIGSITESMEMIQLAYDNGYGVMPCSSRGEDIDICDYSVGINATTIRESGLGSAGTRFLEIEAELGPLACFAGTAGLKGGKWRKNADIAVGREG